MDTNIRFKIASVFAGEGFQKANEAASSFGQAANKGKAAAVQLTGALSQIPGTAGKVATACGSVATALAQGGIIAGVAATAMAGVKLWFEKSAEAAQKLVEKTREAGVAIQEKLAAAINGVLEPTRLSFEKIGAAVDADERSIQKMEAAVHKLNSAMGARGDSSDAANIVNLELEKLNAVIQAENENAANLASAEYDLKIALEKKTNDIKKNELLVSQARQDEQNASDKYTRATNNLASAKDHLNTAENALRRLEDAGCDDSRALNQAKTDLKNAQQLLKTREDQVATAAVDLQIAHVQVETALNNQKASVDKNDIEVTKTTDALEKLRKKIDQAEVAEQLANEARDDLRAAENKRAELMEKRSQKLEEAESAHEAALQNLSDAQRNYAEWEEKHAQYAETSYTKMQQINLQKLADAFDKAPKMLNNTQQQMVKDWQEWLKYQGDNPWKDAIMQAEIEVQRVDEEFKSSVRSIDSQITTVGSNIQSLNNSLIACLKIH